MTARIKLGRWVLILLGALLILLVSALVVHGGTAQRGSWLTTGFQVVNLGPWTANMSAGFYAPDGNLVYRIDDSLPGGEVRAYHPASRPTPLPDTFTGTLALNSDGQLAAAIIHLEGISETERMGNTIFDVPTNGDVGPNAFTPLDGCTILYVQALTGTAVATIQVNNMDGTPAALPFVRTIPANGAVTMDLVAELGLGSTFVGTAVFNADQPIEVTAAWTCGGLSSFMAPLQGSTNLYVPQLPSFTNGLMTTTIFLQNTTGEPAVVDIRYVPDLTDTAEIPPWGAIILNSPYDEPPLFRIYLPLIVKSVSGGTMTASTPRSISPTALEQSAIISSSQPLVVVVRSLNGRPGEEGSLAYRAFSREDATPAVALPILFAGYHDWWTNGRIWIRNLGPEATQVKIRFSSFPPGAVTWRTVNVDPGAVQRVLAPPLAQRSAAIMLADQPIVAVAGAVNPTLPLRDRQIRYRGVNFDFTCSPVALAGPNWSPLTPTVGAQVTMNVLPSGTTPYDVMWDFGDGTQGSGAVTSHTYMAPGQYTVTAFAANCLGFYTAAVSGQITVVDGALYSAYAGDGTGAAMVDLLNVKRDADGWTSRLAVESLTSLTISVDLGVYSSTTLLYSASQDVPPYSPWVTDLISVTQLPTLPGGYAILSSPTGPIAGAANTVSPSGAMATDAPNNAGNASLYAPLLCMGPTGWVSTLTVRNVGTTDALVTVNYSDGTTAEYVVPMGGVYTFDQAQEPHNSPCFTGSVSGAQPLVGLVSLVNQSTGGAMSYNAFTSGSLVAHVPYVVKQPGGWESVLFLQSTPGYPTNVTVSYPGYPLATHTVVVPSIGYLVISTTQELNLPADFQGSMVLTSTMYPVAVLATLHNPSMPGDAHAAYNASQQPGISSSFPYAPKAAGEEGRDWNAYLVVQNASSAPANVWLYFFNEAGASFSPPVLRPGLGNPFSLVPGAMERIAMSDITALPPGVYASYAYSNQPIVGAVQLDGVARGRAMTGWEGRR